MIKVIFTDGTEMNFHGSCFVHEPNQNRFLICQPDGIHTVIIPEHAVKVCGVWDKEKNEFK